jgi:mRNA-degrading endonuclease RelE of RelBE toxin-antitoxin system
VPSVANGVALHKHLDWLEPAGFGATWELRFGPKNSFRVFYEVNHEEKIVSVLAIGVKEANRLFIGGQEFEL